LICIKAPKKIEKKNIKSLKEFFFLLNDSLFYFHSLLHFLLPDFKL